LLVGGRDHPLKEIHESYAKGIADAVIKLKSLRETLQEKLNDMEESSRAVKVQAGKATTPGNRRVFIVHGRDELLKETTARFISKFNLDPIILHEQPNQGKTIIEKLEANVDVDFTVVLLTPDDIGHSAEEPEQKSPRARQNVTLELGLFIGALGRERVCALYKDEVEIPSDYRGVVFIKADEGGAWKLARAREIKESGIETDINKAIQCSLRCPVVN
jgi:predicted nucleotide-binding protein